MSTGPSFNIVETLTLENQPNITLTNGAPTDITCVVIDSEYSYWGLQTPEYATQVQSTGIIVKVRLGDLAVIASLPIPTVRYPSNDPRPNDGSTYPRCGIIDKRHLTGGGDINYGYFGTTTIFDVGQATTKNEDPGIDGQIIIIDLDNMKEITRWRLLLGTATYIFADVKVGPLCLGDPETGDPTCVPLSDPGHYVQVPTCAVKHGFYGYFGTACSTSFCHSTTKPADFDSGTEYASPGIIIKLELVHDHSGPGAQTSIIDKLELDIGDTNLSCAIIDAAGEYGYFGTGTYPARVIKVKLHGDHSDPTEHPGKMTRAGSIDFCLEGSCKSADIRASACRSALMGENGIYGYFALVDASGGGPWVAKVLLESDHNYPGKMTQVMGTQGMFPGAGDGYNPFSGITDGVHGWFGTGGATHPPANIVKLRLDDLNSMGDIDIPSYDHCLTESGPHVPSTAPCKMTVQTAVIGPAGNYGYFGIQYIDHLLDAPKLIRIVKVGLGKRIYDISNVASWADACDEYNTNQSLHYNRYLLTNDTTLKVSELNGTPTSRYFYEFAGGATFDGSGHHLTLDGTGTTDISMSLFKDLGGTIQNFTFDISGCTSLESNKGFLVGTSAVPSVNTYGNFHDISVNNLNSTVADAGGYMVGSYFGHQTANDITITNCNFTGDVSGGSDKGGLFGAYLFHEASGNITIQYCDISGTVDSSGGGGITGSSFGGTNATMNVDYCTFKGDVSGTNAGGLLGAGLLDAAYGNVLTIDMCSFEGNVSGTGSGGMIASNALNNMISPLDNNIAIEHCDISAVISGTNAGGMFGSSALINNIVTNCITIADNTFNVDLQGANTAAMFGYNMLNDSTHQTLNIGLISHGGCNGPHFSKAPNTIIIHDVSASAQTAGIGVIAVEESIYINGSNGVRIKNNIIKSGAIGIPFENFGGIFDVSGITSLTNPVGKGALTIELNNFTDLSFTSIPPVYHNYLFNNAGIEYFNDTGTEIFAFNTIDSNHYGGAVNIFEISNISSWQAACEEWNTFGDASYQIFQIVAGHTILVTDLNHLSDTSNNFHEFTGSFNGQGVHTLTLDGTGLTDISKSLFMDLSGGTIYGLTLDISGCTTTDPSLGFLVGKSIASFNDYGNFHDISVNNLSSTIPPNGGYMVGRNFGQQTDASINITNCNFTGNVVDASSAGGLFGYGLFYEASGSLIISNCDISGNVNSNEAGGLAGDRCCISCKPSAKIDIGNCTFTGKVNATDQAGGLFGKGLFYTGAGDITITDCSINATINGGCNGGLGGQLCFYNNKTDASINITNCNFIGEIAGHDSGGLFGAHSFRDGFGDVIIKDCDISGIVSGLGAGGLGGDNCFAHYLGGAIAIKAEVLNCTFTGDISGDNAGGLFGAVCFQNADGNLTFQNCSSNGNVSGIGSGGLCGYQLGVSCEGILTINNCSSTGNVSGPGCGGIAGSYAFYDCSATSNINIISNQFNGSIISDNSANGSGGLFGSHFYKQGKGTLTISGCYVFADISGTAGGAGGLIGSNSHETSDAAHTTTITNCTFYGTIGNSTAESCGGFFGENLCSGGGGTFTIQDCQIFGPGSNALEGLMGKNCGGIAPCDSTNLGPFSNVLSGTTIDICNNLIQLDIQGANSGGIFGPNMLADTDNVTLNIKHNYIIITSIQGANSGGLFGPNMLAGTDNVTLNIKNNYITIGSAYVSGAGIAVYDLATTFDNRDNSVNIKYNTIRTNTPVSSLNFGGVFYVNNGAGLVTTDGSGTLRIQYNNLSGINLSPLPSSTISYVFNTAGIPFFDTSVHSKIFLTSILTGNLAGPLVPPPLRYKGNLLFLKYSLFYSIKNGAPFAPKKVRVFNKPKNLMTKNEIISWGSRNKYR